ncbi:MAG: hypothetical protein ACK2TS_03010 [Anaerolineales bacterium]
MAVNKKPSRLELNTFEQKVLKELGKRGELSQQDLDYFARNKVRIGFSRQKYSGARWTLFKKILLNANSYSTSTDPSDPGLLSLVVHEVHHMQQGLFTAMSVYGELDAWQVGFRFYQQQTERKLKGPLVELLAIPLTWERQNLIKAKELMKDYSPGYRIDWYPIYPIHHEIIWKLTHRQPGESQ